LPTTNLFVNIIYPITTGLAIAFIIFICSYLYRKIKKSKKSTIDNVINTQIETAKNKLLFEIKEKANFYRDKENVYTYLLLSVLFVNNDTETIIVREIEAIMGNSIGRLLRERKIVLGTHSGNSANYILGVTENLIPIALTPNTPIDAYMVFEFSTPNIAVEKIDIKFFTSDGELLVPLSVEIIE
jgi:hypothetical protein